MEITINEQTYQIGKLSAMQQFHVARRLAPVFTALGAAAQGVLGKLDKMGDSAVMSAIGPIAEVVSKMSDEDTEYVLNVCLSACVRKQTTGWQRVTTSEGGLMFADIDMPVMLQLAFAVIRENMANFTTALPGKI